MTAVLHAPRRRLWRAGRGNGAGYGSLKLLFELIELETGFRNIRPTPRILAYSEGVDHTDVTFISIIAY
jgi:hypothetical protein